VIAGVVLAAGSGSRFARSAKQLAELDGIPLLEHALRAIEAVPAIERVVVVLGARADEILAGVDFGAAEPVVCGDWTDGQAASLRCGIEAVAGAEAAVLTLGDMPRITPQVIARFADIATSRRRSIAPPRLRRRRLQHPTGAGPRPDPAAYDVQHPLGAVAREQARRHRRPLP
jgi:CTP:molybdopterin cytidylyltransferase MocA